MNALPCPKLLFFDVGGTLASEERIWSEWADWLAVPRGVFFAALGAVIEARRHHEDVFGFVKPGLDLAAEREARIRAGHSPGLRPADLYPDAAETLAWARQSGFRLGFAGNNPVRTEEFLRSIALEGDIVGSSGGWGVAKPDPRFFQRIVDLSGLPPEEIVYVGDRIDNDVLPALRLGLRSVFVERGPWGVVQGRWPEAAEVPWRVRALSELPALMRRAFSLP